MASLFDSFGGMFGGGGASGQPAQSPQNPSLSGQSSGGMGGIFGQLGSFTPQDWLKIAAMFNQDKSANSMMDISQLLSQLIRPAAPGGAMNSLGVSTTHSGPGQTFQNPFQPMNR